MSNSFDKTAALILAVRTADGTAQQLTSEFKEAVNTAVQNVQPEIQKLGAYLCKAFDIAQPMAQVQKQFENLMKEASRGRFMEDHIQQVMRLRDTFTQVGDAQRKFLADGLLSVHGFASGKPGQVNPQAANQYASWQIANTMGGQPNPEYDRIKLEEAIFKGFQRAGESARAKTQSEHTAYAQAQEQSIALTSTSAAMLANSRPGGRAFYHTNRKDYNEVRQLQSVLEANPEDSVAQARLGQMIDAHYLPKRGRIWRGVHNDPDNPDNSNRPLTFKTAKGSEYTIVGDGTSRKKFDGTEHSASDSTRYVSSADSQRILDYHNKMKAAGLDPAYILGNKNIGLGANKLTAEKIPFSFTPAKGLVPFEHWKTGAIHVGHEITGFGLGQERQPDTTFDTRRANHDAAMDVLTKVRSEEAADRARRSKAYEATRSPYAHRMQPDAPNPMGVNPVSVAGWENYYDRAHRYHETLTGSIPQQAYRAHLSLSDRLRGVDHDAEYNSSAAMTADEAARYNTLPRNVQRRIDRQREREGRPRHFMAGHNFRFAAQNLGFGIDDAIQSYHYGGIGASVRAASNNVTAIAGMTIPNPAVAAGAVVALSIASALIPIVARKFGFEEYERQGKIYGEGSQEQFKRTGTVGGNLRRGTATLAGYRQRVEDMYSLSDQRTADIALQEGGYKFLEDLGGSRNLKDHKSMEIARNTYLRTATDAEDFRAKTANFDATVQYLKDNPQNQYGQHAKYNMAVAHEQAFYNDLPNLLRRQEETHIREKMSDRTLYQADTVDAYNLQLRQNYEGRLKEINRGGGNEKDKYGQRREAYAEYLDQTSRRHDIDETVRRNNLERGRAQEDFINGVYGSNRVSSTAQQYRRHREDILDAQKNGTLSPADAAARLSAVSTGGLIAGQFAMQDELRSAHGYNSQIGDLTINYSRQQHQYTHGIGLNPTQRSALLDANTEGFNRQRSNMIANEMSDRVNNPGGHIQSSYAASARNLRDKIADGFYSDSEGAQLKDNLITKYAYDMKHANMPHGTERFISDAMTVGSAQDRELQQRMLGTFGKRENGEDLKELLEKSLIEFEKHTDRLSDINSKLEIVRSEL